MDFVLTRATVSPCDKRVCCKNASRPVFPKMRNTTGILFTHVLVVAILTANLFCKYLGNATLTEYHVDNLMNI